MNTELFFDEADVETAMAVCAQCPVKAPCGRFAKVHDESHGVWGGLTAEGRSKKRLAYFWAVA